MTTALGTLAQIRCFLSEDVLPVMPAELAGEVRAAVKLLRTVETEVDRAYPLLRKEIMELLALNTEALAAAPELAELRSRAELGDASLSELDGLHRDLRALSSRVLATLQEAGGGPLLDRFYATLGRHAEARLHWQAVFPVSTEGTTA